MKLEDIIAEWDKDGTIDQTNVSNESGTSQNFTTNTLSFTWEKAISCVR